MSENVDLLNAIYQNTRIGEQSIHTLLGHVEDTRLKQDMLDQMAGYAAFSQEATSLLQAAGTEQKPIGFVKKAAMSSGIQINAWRDSSKTHIAEMLIEGSTMGVIDLRENLSRYPQAEQDTLHLTQKVIRFEEKNIERLKEHL